MKWHRKIKHLKDYALPRRFRLTSNALLEGSARSQERDNQSLTFGELALLLKNYRGIIPDSIEKTLGDFGKSNPLDKQVSKQ